MNCDPTRSQKDDASIERTTFRRRVIRHLMVGGGGTAGYFLMVAFLVEGLAISPVMSVIISYSIVALYTYLLSRRWVFNARSEHIPMIFRFLVLLLVSFVLNTGIMYVVTESLAQSYLWGLLGSAAIVPATNFVIGYFWVFK